jgi:5,10-methylenetetrahydrofolate reductase
MIQLEEKAAEALNHVLKAEKLMAELGHTKYSLSGMCSAAMRHDLEKEVCQLLDELAKEKKQRDIAIDAIKEIMANEEGLHRMGYNPYLISHAAMEKINNHET